MPQLGVDIPHYSERVGSFATTGIMEVGAALLSTLAPALAGFMIPGRR